MHFEEALETVITDGVPGLFYFSFIMVHKWRFLGIIFGIISPMKKSKKMNSRWRWKVFIGNNFDQVSENERPYLNGPFNCQVSNCKTDPLTNIS